MTAKALHDLGWAVWTGTGSVFSGHNPHLPYKSILCALNETPEAETPEAEAALRAEAAFARDYDAQLWLVHVVETLPVTDRIDFSRYEKELMEGADLRLRLYPIVRHALCPRVERLKLRELRCGAGLRPALACAHL